MTSQMTNCGSCKHFQLAYSDYINYTRCALDGVQVYDDCTACGAYSPRPAGAEPDRVSVRRVGGEVIVTPISVGVPSIPDVDIDDFADLLSQPVDVPEVGKDEFIVVVDKEHEGFGVYETAQDALDAVKASNLGWWANRPYFATIKRESCKIGIARRGDNEYLTLYRPDGSERNPYEEIA